MHKAKAPPAISEPNVIPFADVMLVMLIIFMVITPMLSKGVSVDMVMTDNPIAMQDADRDDAILLAVTRDGRIYLGSAPTTIEDLPQIVRDALETQQDKTVYLKADARAVYERVVAVVDNVRSAGVDNVGLLTQKRSGSSAATLQ